MNTMRPDIRPFDPCEASDEDFQALNALHNRLEAERLPKEPPEPLDHTVERLRNIPDFVDFRLWGVWTEDGGEMVGRAGFQIYMTETNQHMAEFGIGIAPEWRRKGLGTELLERIAVSAREKERRLLITDTADAVPSGEAFMKRIGGTPGMRGHTNALDLTEVDRDLLRGWQERARQRAGSFEMVVWEGAYPEEELERVAAMYQAANFAPRDDLDVEDDKFTPDLVREWDAVSSRRGVVRWHMHVRDAESGQVAGFTEVYWHPSKPDMVDQGWTAVFPEYQNRGLGRWLKAAMLEKVLRDRRQARRVHTGNADSNGPMLKINHELGFKPYAANTYWQVETDRVFAYLQSKGEATVEPVQVEG